MRTAHSWCVHSGYPSVFVNEYGADDDCSGGQ
jgi:hypothetical protein